MEERDIEPRTKRPKPRDLEVMAIEALHEKTAELEAEIARIGAAIDAKQSWRNQADTFFKS